MIYGNREMPKKKPEELETEEISAKPMIEDTAGETKHDENPEVSEELATAPEETSEAVTAADSTETPSFTDNVVETVGAAAGSLAATVSDGISSVVSAVTGNSPTTESVKPQHSKRAERIGIVQSDKMTKTVTVRIERQVKHPIYRKYIKRRKNFMAHDEQGAAVGDKVRIVETRPLSAKKRWRVVEIIQKAER